VEETVVLAGVLPGPIINMLDETAEGHLPATGHVSIRLEGYEGKTFWIKPA